MLPTLFSIGPLSVSTFGLCTMLAFVVGAFIVWRAGRDRGITDEKILDNIVVATVTAFVGARLLFVFSHWSLFAPNMLRSFLVWKFPGLSLWGALILGMALGLLFARKQKLSLLVVFDAYGQALPWAALLFSLGVFLDGSLVGQPTTLPWAMSAVGQTDLRHPVALYSLLLYIVSAVITYIVYLGVTSKKLRRGTIGAVSLLLISVVQLILAFVRGDLLYLAGFPIEILFGTITIVGTLVAVGYFTELISRVNGWAKSFKK